MKERVFPSIFGRITQTFLAGSDVLRGGTWSGITKSGRFASMTNRPFDDFPSIKDSYSRGKLVKDYYQVLNPLVIF